MRSGGVGQTALLFYNARYYDPKLGRFLSPDSIAPAKETPQTRNRYSYVLNNPLKLVDPTGHCEKGDPLNTPENARCVEFYARLQGYGYRVYNLWDWMSHELELVLQGTQDLIAAAHWSVDQFKSAMAGRIGLDRSHDPSAGGLAGYQNAGDITLYDGACNAGDAFAKRVVVHELGHQWDWASGAALSSALVARTGGEQTGCYSIGPYQFCLPGATYTPGESGTLPDPRNAHFTENQYEDFAESVAATVYGAYNAPFLGSNRNEHVKDLFARYGGYGRCNPTERECQ